jgi:hypothetical protein
MRTLPKLFIVIAAVLTLPFLIFVFYSRARDEWFLFENLISHFGVCFEISRMGDQGFFSCSHRALYLLGRHALTLSLPFWFFGLLFYLKDKFKKKSEPIPSEPKLRRRLPSYVWVGIFVVTGSIIAGSISFVKMASRSLPPLVISHSPLPSTTPETTPTNNLPPEETPVAERDIGGCKSLISEVTQNLINRDYGNSGYKGFFTQAGEDGRNVAIVPLLYADKGYCLQYPDTWEIELEGLNESGLFFNRSIIKNGGSTDVFPPTTTGTIQALQVQVTGRDDLSLEDADKATMSYELSGPHPLVKADEKVISKNIITIGTKEVLRLRTQLRDVIYTRYILVHNKFIYYFRAAARTTYVSSKDYTAFLSNVEQMVASMQFVRSDPADWHTYRDENLGFEFNYPHLYEGLLVDSDGTRISISHSFAVVILDNPQKLRVKEWYRQLSDCTKILVDNNAFAESTIQNGIATIKSNQPFPSEYYQKCGPEYGIYLVSPLRDYVISFSQSDDASEVRRLGYSIQQMEVLHQQILSTFKFFEPTPPSVNEQIKKLKVGDEVQGMKVSSSKPLLSRDTAPAISEDNVEIGFVGRAKLTGQYEYYEDGEPFFGGQVCFENSGDYLLPFMPERTTRSWFCFSNKDFAKAQFSPQGSKGTATVVIDNYVARFCGCEAHDEAKLVEVTKRD